MEGSSLWLLEAKPFATEERSEKASTVKFWLRPGTAIVGRQGSDVPVEEDKSISRKHAEITVLPAKEWRQEGGAPCVIVKDLSKYGTIISPSGTFEETALSGASGRVPPNCMLRFGFKSPFKLYHQDWVLYLSPEHQQAADPGALTAVQAAAAATGLPLTDELPNHRGTRVLALAAAPLRVDGPLLLALLRRYPIVGASWLLEWQQQKVWCNSRPQEESYPVALQYSDTSGRVKALPSPAALLQAAEQQLLGGRTLLWLPPARDAALQEAARLLGAANSDVAAAGRAPAAAKATGAVLVRGSDADAMPATYRRLPWTTPALLLVGMLEGSLDSAVHLPEEEPDTTPSAAKKGGKGHGGSGSKAAPGRRSTAAGGKSKGRAGARGGKGGDSQQQDSGSETDVSEDLSHLRGTQRVLAAEVSKPSPPSAAKAAAARHDHHQQDQQQQQQHAEEAPVVSGTAAAGQAASPRRHGRKIAVGAAVAIATAASPGEAGASQGAAAGGRKRRQPEHQEQQEEEEEMLPTASKKQRQGAPTAAAAATAQQQLVEMPTAEGWHTKHHGHIDEPAAAVGSRDTSPAGRQPVRPSAAAAAASAAKPAPAGAGGGGGRLGARAASAAAAAAAKADRELAGGEEEEVEDPEAGEEGGGAAVVAYLPLVVPRLPPSASAAASGGARGRGRGSSNAAAATGGLPNYKAFRKGGDGGVAAAVGRRVVGYDAEPYVADGPADADAFLRAEAQRRQQRQQADELFSANVKARKAAQLPDPDDDTPPKGRGRGAKKAKSPADSSQQSMLNFLPAAGGRGRGRGGGGGRGRGRG